MSNQLETIPTDEPQVVPATTVDMLIERIGTHPQEFFNTETIWRLDATETLVNTRWRTLTSHLCNPATTGLFSQDEKKRFTKALDVAMRQAFDAHLCRALVTGETLDAEFKREESKKAGAVMAAQQMAAQQNAQNQAYQNALYGQGMLTTGIGQSMNAAGLALGAVQQGVAFDQAYVDEVRREYEERARQAFKTSKPQTTLKPKKGSWW